MYIFARKNVEYKEKDNILDTKGPTAAKWSSMKSSVVGI
jgi:hypothetical protein